MTIASAHVLSGHLKPLCPRDNHVMRYESASSRANTDREQDFRPDFVATVLDGTQ